MGFAFDPNAFSYINNDLVNQTIPGRSEHSYGRV